MWRVVKKQYFCTHNSADTLTVRGGQPIAVLPNPHRPIKLTHTDLASSPTQASQALARHETHAAWVSCRACSPAWPRLHCSLTPPPAPFNTHPIPRHAHLTGHALLARMPSRQGTHTHAHTHTHSLHGMVPARTPHTVPVRARAGACRPRRTAAQRRSLSWQHRRPSCRRGPLTWRCAARAWRRSWRLSGRWARRSSRTWRRRCALNGVCGHM